MRQGAAVWRWEGTPQALVAPLPSRCLLANLRMPRYRQALAVINDMTDPTDPDSLRGINIMRCQARDVRYQPKNTNAQVD